MADDPRFERSIDTLDLPARTRWCLGKGRIATIGDLAHRTAGELMLIRGVGQTSLRRIRDELGRLGLGLRDETD